MGIQDSVVLVCHNTIFLSVWELTCIGARLSAPSEDRSLLITQTVYWSPVFPDSCTNRCS